MNNYDIMREFQYFLNLSVDNEYEITLNCLQYEDNYLQNSSYPSDDDNNMQNNNSLESDGLLSNTSIDDQSALWNDQSTSLTNKLYKIYTFVELSDIFNLKPQSKVTKILEYEKINLKYYGIDHKFFNAICNALENNVIVKSLNLEGNLLSPDDCYHLNKLLHTNSTITSLNLSRCRINPKGVLLLNNTIIRNLSLQELNLSNCNICDEGMHYLSNALEINSGLLCLILKNNNITNASAKDIYNMLYYNYTLQKLDVSWNNLSSETSVKYIFDGLLENKYIKDFDLSWNGLSSEKSEQVIRQLCLYLSQDSSLESLKLQYNRFTESDADKIGQALSKNTTLKILYLGGNPILSSGALKLIQNIEISSKSSLKILELSQIFFSHKNKLLFNFENNEIKRENFKDIIQQFQLKFNTSSLITKILETVPRNTDNSDNTVKKKSAKSKKNKSK